MTTSDKNEYELLRLLVWHAGRVVTHQLFLRETLGRAVCGRNALQRVLVSGLRQKLDDPAGPRYIVTEQVVGHRLLD